MTIEKRSLAGSDAYATTLKQPVWTQWTVSKGVKEGYKFNGWVYRAAKIIAEAAASVPWAVMNDKGPQWEHPLSKMLANPNPHYSRQKLIELLTLWMQLSGTGYFKKVMVSGRTAELWPVSPDRMAPIPSADPAIFIDGYKVKKDGGREERDPDYTGDTVMRFVFTDPSDPYSGMSPLAAAARAVDLDNEQAGWNTAVMQNRAVPEGVFTFKRDLDAAQHKSIVERIKDRLTGSKRARDPMVVGSEANYQRLSLSPVELDYLESRKAGRDEIFGIYGVPPQLGGAMEAMTYSNYAAALRILWVATVIPLLDNFKDTMNTSLADELQDGKLWIGYDLTNVAALKADETERVGNAKTLFEMGVPVSIINDRLELGITEYPGWDKSQPRAATNNGNSSQDPPPDPGKRSFNLVPLEQRSVDDEMKLRDDLAEGEVLKLIMAALDATREAVMADVMVPAEAAMAATSEQWTAALQESYLLVGTKIAAKTAKPGQERRDAGINADDEIKQAIQFALDQESVILTDLSAIHASTVQAIVQQVAYGIEAGWGVTQIQQAILDTGIFSPERALVIARTTAGTAASIGQMTAGSMSGATHKVWLASHAHTRPEHEARNGEVVPMSGTFSARIGPVGPRYPLDPLVAAGDRINCRCYMTFQMR